MTEDIRPGSELQEIFDRIQEGDHVFLPPVVYQLEKPIRIDAQKRFNVDGTGCTVRGWDPNKSWCEYYNVPEFKGYVPGAYYRKGRLRYPTPVRRHVHPLRRNVSRCRARRRV
jgi:hypothetical protein